MTSSQTTPSQALEARLLEMEIQQTYQDSAIEALEKTVAQQHQEIQLLNKKLSLLSEYIKSLPKESNLKPLEDENPPPHY